MWWAVVATDWRRWPACSSRAQSTRTQRVRNIQPHCALLASRNREKSGLSVLTPGGRPADSSARSHECACRESHMCPSTPFVVKGRSVFRGRATALGTLRRAESVTCVGGRQRAAERSHRHTLRAGPRAEVRAILELLPRRRNLFLQSEDPGCQRTVHRGARSDDQRAWRQPGRYGTERDFTGHVEQENRSTS